ncbi:MAG: hypothetical protein IV107_21560 [Paucibacter sp.]|nr:hypothetical protein [Roseateles sp.]
MLVDIVELRNKGVRRPKAEVRASCSARGLLLIHKLRPWEDHDGAPVFATLSGFALPDLYRARVLYISGRNIVVAGQQDHGGGLVFPQAWWCRVVMATSACMDQAEFEATP